MLLVQMAFYLDRSQEKKWLPDEPSGLIQAGGSKILLLLKVSVRTTYYSLVTSTNLATSLLALNF